MAYKKDQGRMARMTAFWSIAILLLYGCISLYRTLTGYWPNMAEAIGGFRIPIIGLDLNPALLVTLGVLSVGLFALYTWQQRPKIADLLIETESELRKVTWPTLTDAINSSVVVIIFVIFLMAFLAGSDWMLGRWAKTFLSGS